MAGNYPRGAAKNSGKKKPETQQPMVHKAAKGSGHRGNPRSGK